MSIPSLIIDPASARAERGETLIGLDRAGLAARLGELGVPERQSRMRVGQLWNWLYVRGATDFARMTDIAKEFRAELDANFTLARPEIVTEQVSSDGTRKWLLRLGDGKESRDRLHPRSGSRHALHLEPGRLHAHLQLLPHRHAEARAQSEPAEIVGQIMVARDRLGDWPGAIADDPRGLPDTERKITNVVLMGMGEPLYNFDNVRDAMAIAADGEGLSVSKRRITLSTSGIVPEIPRWGEEAGTMLAISLHAVRDELRDQLVPINKKWPIKDLLAACRAYPGLSNAKRITFEYVMLKGVNDSIADAKELVRLLAKIPAKINLIPFNPWPGAPYECSDWEQIEKFGEVVNRAGYASPVRSPRGRDIMAACGQLKSASIKQRASERVAPPA